MADEGYAEFIRWQTPHLQLVELRPVPLLGIRRWLVRSSVYEHFRPVVAWGDETRARNRAQQVHADHARAVEAVRRGWDADLAGTGGVRREYRLLYLDDPALRVPDLDEPEAGT